MLPLNTHNVNNNSQNTRNSDRHNNAVSNSGMCGLQNPQEFNINSSSQEFIDINSSLYRQAPLTSLDCRTWTTFLNNVLIVLTNTSTTNNDTSTTNNELCKAIASTLKNNDWDKLYKHITHEVNFYWYSHGVQGYDEVSKEAQEINSIIIKHTTNSNDLLADAEINVAKVAAMTRKSIVDIDDNTLAAIESLRTNPDLEKTKRDELYFQAVDCIKNRTCIDHFLSRRQINYNTPVSSMSLEKIESALNEILPIRKLYEKLKKYPNLTTDLDVSQILAKIENLTGSYNYFIEQLPKPKVSKLYSIVHNCEVSSKERLIQVQNLLNELEIKNIDINTEEIQEIQFLLNCARAYAQDKKTESQWRQKLNEDNPRHGIKFKTPPEEIIRLAEEVLDLVADLEKIRITH